VKTVSKIVLVICSILLATSLVGCASANVLANPNAKFPLPVDDKAPAFLFPVNLSHLGSSGDPLVMGVSVTAGVASKYGAKIVSGQQLFDLVGNLSFELAEAIDSQAKAGEWKMTGSAEAVASGLATLMSKLMGALADLKLIPAGMTFKYIIALHSHGSSGMVPGMLSVNSWGGIYDVETKEILSYISADNTMADDPSGAAILAQLPDTYNGIIQHLIDGK
jgi:hypothetical protein